MKTTPKKTYSGGFSLIELVVTLFIITVGLGSLYAVLHRGINHMRIVSSKNYALVAAASELEIVKATPFDKLPENYAGAFMGKVDLSALPNSRGTLRIGDYADSGGNLKTVTATVKWTVAGKKESISISTLVRKP